MRHSEHQFFIIFQISSRDRSNRERLENAFGKAESEFGVTRLLDPEDVDVDHPDEKSVITYVSSLYDALPSMPEPVSEEFCIKPFSITVNLFISRSNHSINRSNNQSINPNRPTNQPINQSILFNQSTNRPLINRSSTQICHEVTQFQIKHLSFVQKICLFWWIL